MLVILLASARVPFSRSTLSPLQPAPLKCKFFLHLHNTGTRSTSCYIKIHWSLTKTNCMHLYKHQCMSSLCYRLTFSCLCFTVLSLRCVGCCVRYTCWQTRFLCVRLSGSGCLTPPAPLVWRQVRGGHISPVPSDPLPCDPSYCHGNSHWKPWLLGSFSTAQPWNNPASCFFLGYLGNIIYVFKFQ